MFVAPALVKDSSVLVEFITQVKEQIEQVQL